MDKAIAKKLEAVKSSLTCNTPMAMITLRFRGELKRVFTKLEYYNVSGSIKDRIAVYIMEHAYKTGQIKPGYEISEASSGNTGIAFSALGTLLGHRVKIFIPDWLSAERINLIKSFGAEVVLVSREQGGFIGSVSMSNDYAKHGNVFLPQQFDNPINIKAHYSSTGPEIERQMEIFGYKPDAFTAGVATAGTILGIGSYLKEVYPKIKLYPMEPSTCTTLRDGKSGPHRIQGIGDEFIPSLYKDDILDEIIDIDDGDAIIMAQRLAAELGLGVGISSGANLLSAVYASHFYEHQNVATTFADDSKKYLTTDYGNVEPVKKGFLSTDIELLDIDVVK